MCAVCRPASPCCGREGGAILSNPAYKFDGHNYLGSGYLLLEYFIDFSCLSNTLNSKAARLINRNLVSRGAPIVPVKSLTQNL